MYACMHVCVCVCVWYYCLFVGWDLIWEILLVKGKEVKAACFKGGGVTIHGFCEVVSLW